MIIADLALDETGIVRSCSIDGHAGSGPTGGDIVCAAVSVLARTALRTLSEIDGFKVDVDPVRKGFLGFVVTEAPLGGAYPAGVSAFLVEGLRSVARDYPEYCSVRVRTERRQDNGY